MNQVTKSHFSNKPKSEKSVTLHNKRKNSSNLFSSNKVIEKYIEDKLKENEIQSKKRFSLDPEMNKLKQTSLTVQEGRKSEVESNKKLNCEALTTLSSKSSNGNNQFKRIESNKSFHTKNASLHNCPSPINWSSETAKIFFDEETSPLNKEDTMKRFNEIKTSLIELINQTKEKSVVIKEIEGIYKKCIASTNENEESLFNNMLYPMVSINGTSSATAECPEMSQEALRAENLCLKSKVRELTEQIRLLEKEKENFLPSNMRKQSHAETKNSSLTPVTHHSYVQSYSNIPEILDLSDSYDGLLPDEKKYKKKTNNQKTMNKTKEFIPKNPLKPIGRVSNISQTPKKNLNQAPNPIKIFRNKSYCGMKSLINGCTNEKKKEEFENLTSENYVQLTLDDEGNEVEVKCKNRNESSS